MNIFRLLKKNKLFADFDDNEINKIFDCLHGHINKYSRGRVVAEAGDPVTEVGIILEGSAVKFIRKADGELVNCGELEVGDMFGEVEGYAGDRTYRSSVVLAEDSTVLYIEELPSPPEIARKHVELSCRQNRRHQQRRQISQD